MNIDDAASRAAMCWGKKMKKVTKEEFFEFIGRKDVHPRCEKDASYWELRDRTVIAKTVPGYLMCDIAPKEYFILTEK